MHPKAIPVLMRIGIHRDLTARRFEQFESYARSLESMLRDEASAFSVRADARLKEMPAERQQDFIEDASEDYAELHETFPSMFRTSLFVMCVADFEHSLNGLADLFQMAKKLEISFKEIRGEGIERARLFLKKVAKVGFPDDSGDWSRIKEFAVLRNLMVHADGRVPPGHKDEKLVERLVSAHPGKLRVDRFHRIVFEKEWNEHVLEVLRRFHASYANALRRRYRISAYSR